MFSLYNVSGIYKISGLIAWYWINNWGALSGGTLFLLLAAFLSHLKNFVSEIPPFHVRSSTHVVSSVWLPIQGCTEQGWHQHTCFVFVSKYVMTSILVLEPDKIITIRWYKSSMMRHHCHFLGETFIFSP